MTTFPTKIKFTADQNKCEFVELVPKTNEAKYQYTDTKTKKGLKFTCTLDYLQRLFDGGLLEVEN